MARIDVVERKLTVQGKVDVVKLGEIALALVQNKIPIRTASALVSMCVDIAHQALEHNKYIETKFERGPLEAFEYLVNMGLMTKSVAAKNLKKVNVAQGFFEIREEGADPAYTHPMVYNNTHNKHSVNHPEVNAKSMPGTMSDEEAKRRAEEFSRIRAERIAKEKAEEEARRERMIAIVEQAERDSIKPALATPPCACPEPEPEDENVKEKKKKVDENTPINAADIDPANYDLEMSLEDRRKLLTPRQQAEWRIAYQKNRYLQNQMKKQPKVNEVPRARGGEELEQFSAWKEKDLAKRDKELQDGFSQFDPTSCAIKED